MKKILNLLFVLIITTAFISGCGKPSTDEVYDYVSKVAVGTRYEDVKSKIGEETVALKKVVTKSGNINMTGKWIMDDKSGSQDKWVEMYFYEGKLNYFTVSREMLREIAEKRKLNCDMIFIDNASYKAQADVDYRGLTYKKIVEVLGKEGLVEQGHVGHADRLYPFTKYLWFDNNGNTLSAIFPRN